MNIPTEECFFIIESTFKSILVGISNINTRICQINLKFYCANSCSNPSWDNTVLSTSCCSRSGCTLCLFHVCCKVPCNTECILSNELSFLIN